MSPHTDYTTWYNYMDGDKPMPCQYRRVGEYVVYDSKSQPSRTRYEQRCSRCKRPLDISHWDGWKNEPPERSTEQWMKLVLSWCKQPECQALNFLVGGGDHDVLDQT